MSGVPAATLVKGHPGARRGRCAWGSTAPGTTSQYAIYACDYPSGSGSCSGASNLAPVGTATLGAGAWGQLDLAGNVYEWNLDYVTQADLIGGSLFAFGPCDERGGGFQDVDPIYLYPSSPGYGGAASPGGVAADRDHGIGFRCARTP